MRTTAPDGLAAAARRSHLSIDKVRSPHYGFFWVKDANCLWKKVSYGGQ
jgi:hypothetical protein